MSTINDILDVRNWELPDPKVMLAKLTGEKPRNEGNFKVIGENLRPLDFYCYLKAHVFSILKVHDPLTRSQ
jgi:hypothetical protein